jgi:hypothetical protein
LRAGMNRTGRKREIRRVGRLSLQPLGEREMRERAIQREREREREREGERERRERERERESERECHVGPVGEVLVRVK